MGIKEETYPPSFSILQEKHVNPRILKCCPTMDLIAVYTMDQQLVVYVRISFDPQVVKGKYKIFLFDSERFHGKKYSMSNQLKLDLLSQHCVGVQMVIHRMVLIVE
jgi:hypothetical protein